MNLTGIPVRPKEPKAKPDSDYLARVRALPCVICQAFGEPQLSPTTAHHPIMGRFSQRKVPDEMALALCDGHHQGNFDTSKIAIHREPNAWREKYGEDREWIAVTQDMVARELSR